MLVLRLCFEMGLEEERGLQTPAPVDKTVQIDWAFGREKCLLYSARRS
jgi:hypothetical protein